MAQGPVFLIGGGWKDEAIPLTYGPFAAAVDGGEIACVLHDNDEREIAFANSVAAFARIGFTRITPVFVSAARPLEPDALAGAGGILVGGGLTPAYHDAIVPSASEWIRAQVANGLPYAGFSAGAMIAPETGIIGGWKLGQGERELEICSEDVSEDEDELDIRAGIGLVPFAVDVHASQYGTPTRLMHAIRAGLVSSGWAVDKETAIECTADGAVTVHGLGSAYAVHARGDELAVRIVGNGERIWPG